MGDEFLPLLGIAIAAGEESDSSDSNSVGDDESTGEEMEAEQAEARKKDKKKKEPTRSISFDTTLPSTHTYLGTDLEEMSGRTILDDDTEIELPLVVLPGTILVPGHRLPLYSHNQQEVAMLKNVVDSQQRTFGVVSLRHENHQSVLADIGTTAEVFSVKNEMDEGSGISVITILAQGRQRFELKDFRRTITGTLQGTVKILPDQVLGDVLDGARPQMHCRLCRRQDADEDLKIAMDRQGRVISCVNMRPVKLVNRFSAANFTWWPPWVYKLYDAEVLVQRVKKELQKWNDTLRPEKLPNNATELSYWVTQNLPLDDKLKLHLLSINNAIQRLRCALSIITKCTVLCCRHCQRQVTDMCNVFSLAIEGPMGSYVNPGGHVHETMTVYEVSNLDLIGRPSTEHSWFPGYAWTIAQCHDCHSHMGWRFTTKRKDLSPQKFWGLCRTALVPGMSSIDVVEKSEWEPVM